MNEINLQGWMKFFWDSVTIEMFLKFIVLYFFIIWIAILVWVIKDINNRTDNILLQIASILIILVLTPLGVFIYLLIRPGKTLFERYYEEIEENLETFSNIIEENTNGAAEGNHCDQCEAPILPEFKFCPKCKHNLRCDCGNCKKSILVSWKICPYCGKKNKKHAKKEMKKHETQKDILTKDVLENLDRQNKKAT